MQINGQGTSSGLLLVHRYPRPPLSKQHLCPSNTRHFCHFSYGGIWRRISVGPAVCNVLILVLRCMMFIFYVKAADWGMMAFVIWPILPLGFQTSAPCVSACTTHSATRKQHPCPSNTTCWFRSISGHFRCLDKRAGCTTTTRGPDDNSASPLTSAMCLPPSPDYPPWHRLSSESHRAPP